MTLCCKTTSLGAASLSAAIHPYDSTCRPQIVFPATNPDYYQLIKAFGQLTGVYGLLNTSFNLHGKPIVSNETDAIQVFAQTDIDYLILGPYIIYKR